MKYTTSKWVPVFSGSAAALLLAACSGEAPEGYDNYEEIETMSASIIIGANDLISVNATGSNVPSQYRGILDGIGRGVNSGALCTATHVGGGIVVSAGHCFGAGPNREDRTSCTGAYVEFGYRNGKSPSRSNCVEMLSKRTGNGYDYAIYRVSPIPAVAVPVQANANPSVGLPLTIFSHPGGRPLEWSQTCSVMSPTSTEFRYQCDTQGGSSGAAVLRNDTLQIVGIHWGGAGQANIANKLGSTPLAEFMNTSGGGGGLSIVSRHSGRCLDVRSSGTADGTNIQQWNCNGTSAQSFRVEPLSATTFRLVNVGSNKCVDVASASTANGANIQLWTCNGTSAQSFRIEDVGGGFFRVVNTNSGLALDVAEWATGDGGNVQQWGYGDQANQQWRFATSTCSGVTVYQHTNYGGYAVQLPPGDYPVSALTARGVRNDDVSSLRIPSGCTAFLYEHDAYGGASLLKTTDDASLVDEGWNDRLSSIRVR